MQLENGRGNVCSYSDIQSFDYLSLKFQLPTQKIVFRLPKIPLNPGAVE